MNVYGRYKKNKGNQKESNFNFLTGFFFLYVMLNSTVLQRKLFLFNMIQDILLDILQLIVILAYNMTDKN